MLNPFPDLLYLSLLAPTILRLALGSVFFLEGYRRIFLNRERFIALFSERWPLYGTQLLWLYGILELGIGVFLVLGLYTQVAALLSLFIVASAIFVHHGSLFFVRGKVLHLLILAISVSLFMTGAGQFAFDLPL